MTSATSRRNRAADLIAQFEDAYESARRCDFDLPSPAACGLARNLLTSAAPALKAAISCDVAAGEDGTIEITAAADSRLLVVDISPSGDRMAMVVQDIASGAILMSVEQTTLEEVVSHIRRAA